MNNKRKEYLVEAIKDVYPTANHMLEEVSLPKLIDIVSRYCFVYEIEESEYTREIRHQAKHLDKYGMLDLMYLTTEKSLSIMGRFQKRSNKMGYTHYWDVHHEFSPEMFAQASRDCDWICDYLQTAISEPISLANGRGEHGTSPVFENKSICFNGVGEDSLETFVIELEENGFDFCKTGRKPYDLAVQCCLIILKYYSDGGMSVRSDGDEEDWKQARELVQEELGYGFNFKLDTVESR